MSNEHGFRIERDSMGEVRVPANALYGAQTQRAVENFPISNLRFPREFIRAMGLIKLSAARANLDLGQLDRKLGALQRLNAMEVSLQSVDSKGGGRLTPADTPPEQTNNTPALVCLTSDAPRQYLLSKATMTIGRSSNCDIQVFTHFVSREHARLIVDRSRVVIEDLGSTNGVFVNSVRVDRQELRHSDLVTVGETQFRFLESAAH